MRFAIVLVLMTALSHASPRTDLASPSQVTRDAAAQTVRTTYKQTPRAKWDKVVASIKIGSKRSAVLATLRRYKPTVEGSAAGGGGETVTYRLDDDWTLVCAFRTADDTLFEISLDAHVRDVWVEPPKQFTGAWTTYFANGQKSHEIHYKDGSYLGTFTSFHDDGSKSVVQTYGPRGIDGEETGYHRSGKVAYTGRHKEGRRIGTWTHYDEAGTVTSVEKLSP